jgi:hypothetical protein
MTNVIRAAMLCVAVAGCASSGRVTGVEWATPAATAFTEQYEKELGAKLSDVEVIAFESNIPGTVMWKAADVVRGGQRVTLPTVIWAEFPTKSWVLQLEIHGDPDGAALARRVLQTLRATVGDPECVWPVLRRTFGVAVEQRIRSAAQAHDMYQTSLGAGVGSSRSDVTFVFHFDDRRVCFTYAIPGDWTGVKRSLYRSADGRRQLWLDFISAKGAR